MLTVSSTTIDNTYINTNSQSTNVSFSVLNPTVFKIANWQSGTGNNYRPNMTFRY